MGAVAAGDEQLKWLKEASNSVKRNAFFMKRALDEDSLREALRYSAAMLGELRTSLLGPQKYYELYMQAFDELRHLEIYFAEEHKKGRSYSDLYELVQHAGNVLPRLYLMCTVGSCFIRSKEGFAKDVLKDLVEMCKGVQHATRGLFLRHYLCQVCKGLLPDVGSPYEGEGGSITDALDFLLVNFTEMNKLWVRMQHQGSPRDKERREKERQQLADLVGKNLTYISQLEGLEFGLYTEIVLPRVVQQIVNCKDDIAQQYLMQCLIQGFPDDFHLGTLDTLLTTCSELQPGVKVFLIMSSLMDRLTKYAKSTGEAKGEFDQVVAFGKLKEACSKISVQHVDMPLSEVIAMYVSLLDFTVNVYTNDLAYCNEVLEACCQAVEARSPASDPQSEKRILALLSIPLEKYDVVTVLGLAHYPAAMALLQSSTCKEMAIRIVNTVLRNNTCVSSTAKVDMLFDFIGPLIHDTTALDEEDIQEEQSLVARLLHHLHSDDVDEQHVILRAAGARITKGDSTRYNHTLPSLVVNTLKLVPRIKEAQAAGLSPTVSANSVLLFVLDTVTQLVDLSPSDTVLQLYLSAAHMASEVVHLELMAYEFFEQAFVIYEESIPDSKAEVTALQSIIGILQRCHVFGSENREALVHKATGYCAKLLRKMDQCRAMCLCSHLFWQTSPQQEGDRDTAATEPAAENGAPKEKEAVSASTKNNTAEELWSPGKPDSNARLGDTPSAAWPIVVRDPTNVMVCLKRALKIANAAQQQSAIRGLHSTEPVTLFVEILNHYLYYFDQSISTITASIIQNLLELAANEMASESCQNDKELLAFYKNTLSHISAQQSKGAKQYEKYKDLQV